MEIESLFDSINSSIVPFKDWNGIVRPKNVPDIYYKVTLHHRKSVKKGYPVVDATLVPVDKSNGKSDLYG